MTTTPNLTVDSRFIEEMKLQKSSAFARLTCAAFGGRLRVRDRENEHARAQACSFSRSLIRSKPGKAGRDRSAEGWFGGLHGFTV